MVRPYVNVLRFPALLLLLHDHVESMTLAHTDPLATLQDMIDKTPPVPDLSTFFEAIPPLGRTLRCACPCIGINGCGQALRCMAVPTETINAYDLESGYRQCLVQQLTDMGMELAHIDMHLKLGKTAGDILRVGLESLTLPVDMLICGPPCPPWAGQGKHLNLKDKKAKVFMRIILWIVVLAHSGGLLCVIVENVKGVLSSYAGMESAMSRFLRILRRFVPFFDWRVDTLDLRDYMFPQSRVRTFLRGLRTCVATSVPPPLPPFGRRQLIDCLGPFPHSPRASFSPQQQENIRVYERKIIDLVNAGKLCRDDIVVIAPDRQDGLTYSQSLTKNCAPTFTTQNHGYMVLSVSDIVDMVPDDRRKFFRQFTESERLTLQGFPASFLLQLGKKLTRFASGNAYPPALIVAALYPMLKAISKSGMDLTKWPDAAAPLQDDLIVQVQRQLNARGRIVCKRKAATNAKKKRKINSSSED